MTLEKIIGNKIRSLRVLKELSQENVAEMLSISVTAYSKIERGETDVQLSRLSQIAAVFKVSIEEILNFGDKIAQSFNGNGTGNSVIISNSEQTLLIELERLRAQNEGQVKEIEHLKKIIALLEEHQK
jgi:transcriptional regulator with XRE-family HTH domain